VAKRRDRTNRFSVADLISCKLDDGYSFYYITYQDSTTPVLAGNICEAFGVLRLWLGIAPGVEMGYEDGSCAVVEITDTPPANFIMFTGRRHGNAIASLISI